VINYELPDDAENYVHRIGRTARNGASGFAITLCDGTERGKLRDVERLIRRTLPVSGDLRQPEMTAPKAKTPHRGQGPRPEGKRPDGQRPQKHAGRHFSGAKKAAIGGRRSGGSQNGRPQRQKQRATA
jgi:ATP-dependent RNA helicase RhlE